MKPPITVVVPDWCIHLIGIMLLTKVRSGSKKGGVRIFSFYKIPLSSFLFFHVFVASILKPFDLWIPSYSKSWGSQIAFVICGLYLSIFCIKYWFETIKVLNIFLWKFLFFRMKISLVKRVALFYVFAIPLIRSWVSASTLIWHDPACNSIPVCTHEREWERQITS